MVDEAYVPVDPAKLPDRQFSHSMKGSEVTHDHKFKVRSKLPKIYLICQKHMEKPSIPRLIEKVVVAATKGVNQTMAGGDLLVRTLVSNCEKIVEIAQLIIEIIAIFSAMLSLSHLILIHP